MFYGFVKCGAYTPEIKVCDVNYNCEKIKNGIDEGVKNKLDIIVFPEMCMCGYTVGDLVYDDLLLEKCRKALIDLASYTLDKDILVFVGCPIKEQGRIYNSAFALSQGRIIGGVPKTFLANYNDSYEKRYFSPAPENVMQIEIGEDIVFFGSKLIFKSINNSKFTVGVEIGNDLWAVTPPSVNHAINGANIIVNLACITQTVGKIEYRRALTSSQSAKLVSGYVYSEAGLGESTTDCVYAGHNLICENGKIINESKIFDSSLTIGEIDVEYVDRERSKTYDENYKIDNEYLTVLFNSSSEEQDLTRSYSKTPFVPVEDREIKERAELILTMQAEGLKKRISHTNAKCAVLGLSGGLDSTLAILVAVTTMKKLNRSPKDVIAVTMPCFGTSSRTYQNTIKLAKALGVTLKKVDITKSVVRHLSDIDHPLDLLDVTYENAQARERTQVIMDIANMNNGLVIGTGDLSELALGWATYNGDHMSMYAVNCSIPKTLVRYIVDNCANKSKGKLKAVLLDILDTPVSPELLPTQEGDISQKTEDIVGPYTLHDFFLYSYIRYGYSPKKIFFIAKQTFKKEFSEQTILKWLKTFFRRFFMQQFKRSCVPDGVKIGTVALSPRGDWKMPSDAVSKLWLEQLEEIKL